MTFQSEVMLANNTAATLDSFEVSVWLFDELQSTSGHLAFCSMIGDPYSRTE